MSSKLSTSEFFISWPSRFLVSRPGLEWPHAILCTGECYLLLSSRSVRGLVVRPVPVICSDSRKFYRARLLSKLKPALSEIYIYIYVCMYVCVYVYIYIYIYIYIPISSLKTTPCQFHFLLPTQSIYPITNLPHSQCTYTKVRCLLRQQSMNLLSTRSR